MALGAFTEVIDKGGGADLSEGAPPSETSGLLNLADHFPSLKELEECLIAEALRQSGGNQGAAARLLGISRQALNKRLTRKEATDDGP